MSLEHEIPLPVARLHVTGRHELVVPLHFPEVARIASNPGQLGQELTKLAEKLWSREGELQSFLEIGAPLRFEAERVTIELTELPKTVRLPLPLELVFDLVLGHPPEGEETRGCFVFVPALGLVLHGPDPETAKARAKGAIQLELARNHRLKNGARLLACQWYEGIEIDEERLKANFYSGAEIEALNKDQGPPWLPRVADRCRPREQRVFGVEDRVEELSRAARSGHNLLLVAPAGTGKSALVEEILRQKDPSLAEVWQTTAVRLLQALTTGDGWQENLSRLCTELAASKAWLWVRNLAELFEVGRYEGNPVSIGEYLRPWLSRGEVRLLSECTPEQLGRVDALYPGSRALFREIVLQPLPIEKLEDVVLKRARADAPRGITIEAEAVRELLRLQRRFSPYSGFPGRPVRFFEGLLLPVTRPHEARSNESLHIDRSTVLDRFCEETGMPRALIDPKAPLSPEEIEAALSRQVFGQPAAVSAVVDVLIGVKAGVARGGRPIASLLLPGPTGVGKTETAKALAAFMFGDSKRLVRIDMSELASPGAAMSLVEGPDGEGRLTGAVRREPFCVLLLDEIEKAHPLVFDLLLQVLGEGRLTDGRGRVADFCSTIVVMTSNLGADKAGRRSPGFSTGGEDPAAAWTAAAAAWFRPELFNRIDRVVAFTPLDEASVGRVLDREMLAFQERPGLRARRSTLHFTPAAWARLVHLGYDPRWGARQLQRAVQAQVQAPVARALDGFEDRVPLSIEIDDQDGALVARVQERRPARADRSERERLEALADEADEARRLGRRIRQGFRLAELRSAWDLLERLRKRLGDRFWKREADVARHGQLQQLLDEAGTCFAELDALGMQLALASLEGEAEAARFEEPVQQTVQRARQLWRRLYKELEREEPPVMIGLYGQLNRARNLSELYRRVCAELDLRATLRGLYQHPEKGWLPLAIGEPMPEGFEGPHGWELLVEGPGARAVFEGEAGLHAWEVPGAEEDRVQVLVEVLKEAPKKDPWLLYAELRPKTVRRKALTGGRPRRTTRRNDFEDALYKDDIGEGPPERQLPALLLRRFDRFVAGELAD